MRKAVSFLCFVALAACSGGGTQSTPPVSSVPAAAERAAQPQSIAGTTATTFASTTWNVGTGASYNYYSDQVLDYLPHAITINAGDSIAYHVASGAGGDAHTVSFVPASMPIPSPGNPNDVKPAGGTTVDGTKFVNSGILFGGQVFTLRFPVAGTFRILCLFHEPAMVMTVTVQRTGTPYPHNALYYLNTGATDEWEDFYDARLGVAQFPFVNGGKTFAAGIDHGLVHFPPPDSTILRYINSNQWANVATAGSITIKVGSVLTWINETSNEPHTITFAVAGQRALPNMPPDPAVNVVAPPGITSYDGSRVVNSGTIIGGQKFMLKFTKPGSYFYGCLYHDNSRMVGTVTVTP